jgi:hypothetical protein
MAIASETLYTKQYPSAEELDGYTIQDLQSFLKSLEDDVGLLEEETLCFGNYLRVQKEKDGQKPDEDEDADGQQGGGGGEGGGGGGGKRRGKSYRRKSVSDQANVYVLLEDKHTILAAEQESLKQERLRNAHNADDARDMLHATVEEAQNRVKEIKLEMAFFKREVVNDKVPSAEKLTKYFEEAPANKEQHFRKLKEKIAVMQQQVQKSQQQIRQREDTSEAFHTIDFDQLKIENHQFNERIEQKNLELVELKGTTTRTVQALNSFTDKLNAYTTEQSTLRRDLKSRMEYVDKLQRDIDSARKEATQAQRKNTALKIQHEAVKVPKVEDYIAQKAEMFELEKAALNWRRKVEIAAGHVAVMKQQMLSLSKKQRGASSAK